MFIVKYSFLILIFLSSCYYTRELQNNVPSSKQELINLVSEFKIVEEKKDVERLLKLVDYEIYFRLNMLIPIDSTVKIKKRDLKKLLNISWAIQIDKEKISTEIKKQGSLDQLKDSAFLIDEKIGYASCFIESEYFFFKKIKNKWKIYFVTKLENFKDKNILFNEKLIYSLLKDYDNKLNEEIKSLYKK